VRGREGKARVACRIGRLELASLSSAWHVPSTSKPAAGSQPEPDLPASQPAPAPLSAFWLAFLVDASRKNNPKPHPSIDPRHARASHLGLAHSLYSPYHAGERACRLPRPPRPSAASSALSEELRCATRDADRGTTRTAVPGLRPGGSAARSHRTRSSGATAARTMERPAKHPQ